MRTYWMTVATCITVLALVAGTGLASHDIANSLPTYGVEELGVNTNDVREEPSHPDDENGFPGDHDGDFWSPKTDPLILDAYMAAGTWATYLDGPVDVDNILNRGLHGSNYDDHERTMYPGANTFGAWWGWWSDTGSGDEFQDHDPLTATPVVGEPNGAIDDADDCNDKEWDEFTFRGPNLCASENGHEMHPEDQMFGFVQPGTHGGLPPSTAADVGTAPDFQYGFNGSGNWGGGTFITYDASLLVSTSSVTAVNPKEIKTSSGITHYDPFTPSPSVDDPNQDYAVDVDVYTTLNPAVEQAYRTAVWDPDTGPSPDRGDNPDLVHEDGLKGWFKTEVPERQAQAQRAATDNVSRAMEPTERQRGLADDLVQDPQHHEPDSPDDQYGYASDGTPQEWATFDADTSYGGLDGRYYEEGADQAYTGYQDGERFWADVRVEINAVPFSTIFVSQPANPELPSTGSPVQSLASESDGRSQAPGFMELWVNPGTWYDANGDGWIGDAGEDGHPYDNGTVDYPNDYSSEEFQPACDSRMETTLYPTSDTDGDGTNDWGQAGVYVVGYKRYTYQAPWMDVIGHAADPVLDPLRNADDPVGSRTELYFPERDRLEKYRTEGPIEYPSDAWTCFGGGGGQATTNAYYWVVLPTGTMDFTFRVETEATLTDQLRVGGHGDTQGVSLTGQSVTDVDHIERIAEE